MIGRLRALMRNIFYAAVLLVALTACGPSATPTAEVTLQAALPTPTPEPTFTPSPPPPNIPQSSPTAIAAEPTPTAAPQSVALSGRILDQDTHQPIAGATVRVGTVTATTDAEGRYTMTGLPPGRYVLSVTHPGYDPGLSSIFTLVAGQELSLDLALYAPDASPYPKDPMLTNPLDPNGAPTAEDAERQARLQGLTREVVNIQETKLSGEYLVNYQIGDEVRAAVAKLNHEVWELTDDAGRTWWIIKVCGNLASPLPTQTALVTPQPRPLPPMAEALVDDLIVRACASEECDEVGVAQQGMRVEVVGCSADRGWCHVGLPGGRSGWCTGQSLRHLAVAEAVPVVDAVLLTGTRVGAAGEGKIAYIVPKEDSWAGDIWIMNADGSGEQQLTEGFNAFVPTWSPDGQKIAFLASNSDPPFIANLLFVMNADSSGLIQLDDKLAAPMIFGAPTFCFRLTWSPDAKKIAYVTGCEGGSPGRAETVMLDLESGSRVQIMSGGAPSWSPIGTTIAMIRNKGTEMYVGDISLVDPASGNVEGWLDIAQAKGPHFSASDVVWAPDGAHLVVGLAPAKVVVVESDGSTAKVIAQPPEPQSITGVFELTWSPDGTKITYRHQGVNSAYPSPDAPEQRMDELFLVDVATGTQVKLFGRRITGEHRNSYVPNVVDLGGKPGWSPDSNLIVVSHDEKIWTIDVESGKRHEIAKGISPAWQPGPPPPTVSVPIPTATPISDRPSGESVIAFLSTRDHFDNRWELYIMNADGTAQFPLTKDASFVPFLGRPQLQWLTGNDEIFVIDQVDFSVVNVADGEIRPWTMPAHPDPRAIGWNGRYSPDGMRFAYVEARNVFVVNADGSNPRQLTDFQGDVGATGLPAWSPDSNKIAFIRWLSKQGPVALLTVNVDGSNLTELAEQFLIQNVAWSSQGDRLVLEDGKDLWLINVDGTGLVNLTNSPDFREVAPSWSPDGTRIAFRGYDSAGKAQIYIINADSGSLTQLTFEGINCCPAWSR